MKGAPYNLAAYRMPLREGVSAQALGIVTVTEAQGRLDAQLTPLP